MDDALASPDFFSQLFGMAMWPLWICSLLLVAMLSERWRTIRAANILDPGMVAEVCDLLSLGDLAGAQTRAAASDSLQGKAWAHGLHEFQLGGLGLGDSLTTASLLALKPLRRNDTGIATVATIAPLFGLLGTIVGMIMTFDQIHATGGADKAELAGGISTALFTTAGGLIVALPAIIGGRYFRARLRAYADHIEADINRANYRLAHHRAGEMDAASAGARP